MRRHRIVMPFAAADLPSFVRADIETLSASHDVEVASASSWQGMWQAARAAATATVLVCWFGSVRYLPALVVARLRGIPALVIAGGYDVAREPAIDYGNMLGGVRMWCGRAVFRLATHVLPYSDAARREAIQNALVPEAKIQTIPLGFDSASGADVSLAEKSDLVLSVGVMGESSIRRKGIVTMLRAAALMPDVRFVLVGKVEDRETQSTLERLSGPNVELTGRVDSARLDALFRSAKVYCQPSVHEAFGCAVAEAMQFNAIAVVSDRGSLPEVVGNAGFYVPPDDPAALVRALRAALAITALPSPTPRTWINSRFPRSRRARSLESLLESLP